MGEAAAMEEAIEASPPPHLHPFTTTKTPKSHQVVSITANPSKEIPESTSAQPNPLDAWLPITESRKGNVCTSTFHILCSGIGIQALLLPLAFVALGWTWGIICLSLAFAWQLYTIWLLVQLHEPVPGTRYSRYLQLSMAAFGEKLGKVLTIFPVMYLSGGTCAMLIITGGGTLDLLFTMVHGDGPKPMTGAERYLMFACLAIVVAQLPNLNSVAGVSLIGAITAIGYCTMIWVLSICKGRPDGVSYDRPDATKSDMAGVCGVLNAIGIIALAFRGHNVVLEIQGTIPTSPKHASKEPMWRGVTMSYTVIAMCLFPLAIGGYWAYGNMMPTNGGMLNAFSKFHGHKVSNVVMGIIFLLVLISSLSSFQVYAMVVFDNLELRYTIKKKKRCPAWLRAVFRVCFGGLVFFVAVALPFLPSLAALIGGMTSPLTFAYPCFMWIAIKRPRPYEPMWCLNLGLGCLGMVLSALLVAAAVWNLATKGIVANFFHPP
ncbi:hypothetical protein L1049_015106 [Liquidambar formosana]|uniref:Amino acid transporter transmembrane domain-containing protein n=1 Tax=Liquidambar formosana TaxID=63359 RepID=A0AAP0X5W6_LIQFO